LRELARHKFLMSGGGCESHILRIFSAAHIEISERLMIKQLPTIQAMVAERLGVSLVPSLSVTNLLRGIRTLRLKPRLFRQVGILRAPGGASTAALEAWITLARSHLKQLGFPRQGDSSGRRNGPPGKPLARLTRHSALHSSVRSTYRLP
jgi:DNA-binding transcriptional LysR family regulator